MQRLWTLPAIAGVLLAMIAGSGLAQETILVRVGGDSALWPILEDAIHEYSTKHPGVKFEMNATDSTQAYQALADGAIHVAMTTREPDVKERDLAKDLVLNRIGMEALAFAVHPSSPMHKITRDQVRDLFMGKIENWKDLGGLDRKIHRSCRIDGPARWYWLLDSCGLETDPQRDEGQDPDRAFVRQKGETDSREVSVRLLEVDRDPLEFPVRDETAIACVPLSRTTLSAHEEGTIRLLELQGVVPTEENVRLGIYPFQRPLNVATLESAPDVVRDFANYLAGPDGQRIVARYHAIPAQPRGP